MSTIQHIRHQTAPGADPEAAAAKFTLHLLSRDCERLVEEFYTEGARFVRPDRFPIVGRDPIRLHWTSVLQAGLEDADIRLSCVERAGAEAVGLGRYHLVFGRGQLESGAFVVRYRRQEDGSWKASEHVFHSDCA